MRWISKWREQVEICDFLVKIAESWHMCLGGWSKHVARRECETVQTKVPPLPVFYSHVETCQGETFSQVNTGFRKSLP